MTTVDGVDVSEDELEGLETLVDALLDEEIVSTLVHNLQRLDDSSNPLSATASAEAQAVHNTLGKPVPCTTHSVSRCCAKHTRHAGAVHNTLGKPVRCTTHSVSSA